MAETTKKAFPSWYHHRICTRNTSGSATEETRTKILQAAFVEIHRVGFQAASINNIIENTGLTKGALYHHFPNKNALGYAVVDEIIAQSVYELWITELEKADDPVYALKQCIINTGATLTQEDTELGCPLVNLSQEMSPIDEGFRIRLEKIYVAWRASVEVSLEKGKKAEYVSADINARQFAAVFVATLEGCMGMAKSAQDMSLLFDCGTGLISILNTLRPQGWQLRRS